MSHAFPLPSPSPINLFRDLLSTGEIKKVAFYRSFKNSTKKKKNKTLSGEISHRVLLDVPSWSCAAEILEFLRNWASKMDLGASNGEAIPPTLDEYALEFLASKAAIHIPKS